MNTLSTEYMDEKLALKASAAQMNTLSTVVTTLKDITVKGHSDKIANIYSKTEVD